MPIALHGREYQTVNERLHAAHGDTDTTRRPVGVQSVATEFFTVGTAILCRATVTFADGRSFQGTSEVPIDSKQPAERDAPFECAETSAWGRALAAADYPGSDSGLAGAEEVQRPPRAGGNRNGGGSRGRPEPQSQANRPVANLRQDVSAAIPAGIVEDTNRMRRDTLPDDEPPLDLYDATEQAHAPQNVTALRPGAVPATPKQLQTVQRMARATGKPAPEGPLTRAQASEFISACIGEMEQRSS